MVAYLKKKDVYNKLTIRKTHDIQLYNTLSLNLKIS